MSARALVIGFGNPLRGDDGLGWEVADRLAADADPSGIEVLQVHQLTPELVEPIGEADLVVFVDATCEGPPGAWRATQVRPQDGPPSPMGHRFDVAALLALAQKLGKRVPRALVVSVTGESFDCRQRLSEVVGAAVPEVVAYIQEKIALET